MEFVGLPRSGGKTTAVVYELVQDLDAIAVVPDEQQRYTLIDMVFRRLYPSLTPRWDGARELLLHLERRILTWRQYNNKDEVGYFPDQRVLVDNLDMILSNLFRTNDITATYTEKTDEDSSD